MDTLLPLITQVFIAIGTLAVAILAIWGEKVRNWIAGPKLELKLRSTSGNLTTRQDGQRTIYYHVKIQNKREWAPARRVRILCTAIAKKTPEGSFALEPLAIPVQLTWAFPTFHELLPNIPKEDICDLGFLDENSEQFKLSPYLWPNNFRGSILPKETIRVSLITSTDNFTSKSPYVLEIYWDGVWSHDLNDMREHLVIKEVKNSHVR
jgi:hypothetical protein